MSVTVDRTIPDCVAANRHHDAPSTDALLESGISRGHSAQRLRLCDAS
jgi:hypothetical protein